MSECSFKPLAGKVLVRQDKEAERSKGGIIIPNMVNNSQKNAIVVAACDYRVDAGVKIPCEVKPGDKVVYNTPCAGIFIEVDGEKLFLMSEGDILGIIA